MFIYISLVVGAGLFLVVGVSLVLCGVSWGVRDLVFYIFCLKGSRI